MTTNQTQQRGSALARVTGTTMDGLDASRRLESIKQEAHLIAPATAVGMLPEGVGIAISRVDVNSDLDTYDVGGGKRGLSKTVLQKLGAALGISWDPVASGRLDDGSNPYYCHWKAVGTYHTFDGKPQILVGEKEMDLREGSAQLEALWERYHEKKKQYPNAKDPSGQVREMRLHIMSHAETKAQLRAIRSLGIKTAYTAEELRKPFIAARACWTGRTNDPDLKMAFAQMTADAFLGGARSLYGNRHSAPPAQLPAPASAPRLAPPPPIGSTAADEDDGGYYDQGDTSEPVATAADGGGDRPSEPPDAGAPEPQLSGHTIPGGKNKGAPIEDADDRDLNYWIGAFEKSINDGSSRNPAKDRERLAAFRAEIQRRSY